MKNFPKVFPVRSFSVMEVGAEKVLIVIADKKDNGELRILGGGEAPVLGLSKGEITHAGDLAESIVGAAQKAQKSAGVSAGKLYYNLDDPCIESAWPAGSKILEGEGEIQPSDVRAAVEAAQRLAVHFEKKMVYAAEVDFMIDDKDPVADPVGIFGHKLDVKVHLLFARADRVDAWMRSAARAGFPKATGVLSGLSSAYGVLSARERQGQRIVWDLGKDYLNGLVMDNGRILEYRTLLSTASEWGHASDVLLALCQEFKKKYPGISEVVLTGELSGDSRRHIELKQGLDIPSRIAVPSGMTRLSEASSASIAGLLQLAGEIENKTRTLRPERGAMDQARAKVRSFLSDYF